MFAAVMIMCGVAVLVWWLNKKYNIEKRPWLYRVAVGVIFGVMAILSTHFGVKYEAMVVNVRDTAPLIAGLLFGPWSGIIAGVIGGVERYIVGKYFGIGVYTTVACSVSTILAGVIAALLRRFVFENKKPTPLYGFAIGAVMEVFHMLALLISKINDINYAFEIVRTVTLPMVLFTALGVMIASFLISVVSGRNRKNANLRHSAKDRESMPITRTFQLWLLVFVVIGFAMTFTFTYVAQTRVTVDNMQSVMKLYAEDVWTKIDEVEQGISDAEKLMKEQSIMAGYSVKNDMVYAMSNGSLSNELLTELCKAYRIYVIEVIGADGVIDYSSVADHIGYDMANSDQSKEFLVLLDGVTEYYVQDIQQIGYDGSYVMYAGVALPDGKGFIQVGYDSSNLSAYSELLDFSSITAESRIGEAGFILVLDEDYKVVSGSAIYVGMGLRSLGIGTWQEGFGEFYIMGEKSYCYMERNEKYNALLVISDEEMYKDRDIFAIETAFNGILLFAIIFVLIFQLVRTVIVRNLHKINQSLARITRGNLSEVVNVRTNAEFTSLSDDINSTVKTLKRYIADAESRIDKELEFAKEIQYSALPTVYPPFPERKEFDICASMDAAKEVGGDFYDYFFMDANKLVMVIADVSGKGIPAALFMMKSKTLIKSLAETGKMSAAKILESANNELCDGNEAEMFVTAWIGILDVTTGEMNCANAGHEYPVIMRESGDFELLIDKHGFVLAGMSGARYREYSLKVNPGDKIFLYTDGVVEATDKNNELYGVERLLKVLNDNKQLTVHETLKKVREDIDLFVGDAPQFDDITMMALELHLSKGNLKELEVEPKLEQMPTVTDFVEEYLESKDIPMKHIAQINIAVDEIFSNIARYSNATRSTVGIGASQDKIIIKFTDDGVPYNPLDKDDPDVTLGAEERQIGGLGIFMVKKTMSDVSYEYTEGRNILTLTKELKK